MGKKKTKQLSLYFPEHKGLKNKKRIDELFEKSSGLDSAEGLDQSTPDLKKQDHSVHLAQLQTLWIFITSDWSSR